MRETLITRRSFVKAGAAAVASLAAQAQSRPPNIVLINADDLGYGDLGCYGSPIRTPNLDRMARDGARLEHFYSASPVCSPSRAALLTGRYPTRAGVPWVLGPDSQFGLPDSETTMAGMLKRAGYNTMCVGKWHLGSLPQYLPTNRGFDEYYGIPYSNDMWPLPLMHNTDVIEQPANQDLLTQRYTDQAAGFIARSKDTPFFLYLAYATPHSPVAASPRFRGASSRGLYGDAIAEMDWSVGQVLNALGANCVDDRTLVMFTSDNGPWYQGSTGGLRGRKGETFEGGVRVPFLARFPGRIPAGVVGRGVASMMDIVPTVGRLVNAPRPANPLDGVDIWPLLSGDCDSVERDALLYFDGWMPMCARLGRWKLHVARRNSPPWSPEPKSGCLNLPLPRAELYDVEADAAESYDAADDNPEVVREIRGRMDALIPSFNDAVRAEWRNTLSRSVEDTAPGAWPVLRSP